MTEDEKSLVRNYFATGDSGGMWESRIWYTYGRMRAHGERIDIAEEALAMRRQQKMDYYKQSIEQQISDGLRDYANEHNESSEYEFMKLNSWENWRTLIIGILGFDGKKVTHTHTVEIVESMNPSYFKECMMKYAPNQSLPTDKPF